MPLSWTNKSTDEHFVASIKLLVKNTSGMLANVANKIAEQKVNITSISSKNVKNDKTIIDVNVSINSKQALEDLMKKLQNIANVFEVTRGENI